MGKDITSMPEAIRTASKSIFDLRTKKRYDSFPDALSSSDGLTAEGMNLLIEKIKNIDSLLDTVLMEFPNRLEKIARLIEAGDNAAASQFK